MTAPLFFQLIHKPTFNRQLLALPRKDAELVLDKTEILIYNPAPDAKNKKRLVGYKGDIFRIRAGDYRILYTFNRNAGWVLLIGVDDRKDVYRGTVLVEDEPDVSVDEVPEAHELLQRDSAGGVEKGRPARHAGGADSGGETPGIQDHSDRGTRGPLALPKPLNEALLRQLRVAEEHHAALLCCRTIDDLIAAPVPEAVRILVFDAIVMPDYDRVLEQPTLRAESPDDFRRFYDGSLVSFLLQLDPEQQRFVDWALDGSGPTLVKGGPGTGKSIIALYRVRSLIEALRRAGVARPRILVTSFTNTLVEASRQLLEELLGPDRELVTVTTVDKLVWDLLADAGALPRKLLDDPGQARVPIAQARERLMRGSAEDCKAAESIATLNLDYLLDEIDQVIVAREHRDLDVYLSENRTGRGVRLTANQRRAIWRLHEERERITASNGAMTFSQLRRRAVELIRARGGPPPFDGVVVDEAQDLEPTAIRLLVALCKSPDRLFLTADPNQSIYGSGFRWAEVHEDLQFRGRTGLLRKNYRSTMEIMRAAEGYLAGAELEPPDDLVDCPRSGPPPLVRYASSRHEELDLISRFLQDATRELRAGLGGCAVLVPTMLAGHEIVEGLRVRGLAAKFMAKKEIDLELPKIKVIPMKSAKGLEFPIVVVAGLASHFPAMVPTGATDDQIQEIEQVGRRSLYVAMTRAMERLLVVPRNDHPLLGERAFDPVRWNVEHGNDTGSVPG